MEKTKFGSEYKDHPTPNWVVIVVAILEYIFASIAMGTAVVPDEWGWWKYVVAGSGIMVGLFNKIKPYFGIVTEEVENK